MLRLGQLTQGAPMEQGGQVCVFVRGDVSASLHTLTQRHTHISTCILFVCVSAQ